MTSGNILFGSFRSTYVSTSENPQRRPHTMPLKSPSVQAIGQCCLTDWWVFQENCQSSSIDSFRDIPRDTFCKSNNVIKPLKPMKDNAIEFTLKIAFENVHIDSMRFCVGWTLRRRFWRINEKWVFYLRRYSEDVDFFHRKFHRRTIPADQWVHIQTNRSVCQLNVVWITKQSNARY